MSEPTEFDRNAYTIEILSELASGKEYEGHQIGPDHSVDQIEVIADLIDEGYVSGNAFKEAGRAVNIGFPRITPAGRAYIKTLIAERDAKRPLAVMRRGGKKVAPAVIKWVAGILAGIIAAYLIKRFGLK